MTITRANDTMRWGDVMALLNGNISIKIKEIIQMSWEKSCVYVSPRPYHALVFRSCGGATFTVQNQSVAAKSADVVYMPANLSYNADYPEKSKIIAIHFYSDYDGAIENFELYSPGIVSALFEKVYSIWTKQGQGYYYQATSLFYEILANIALQNDNLSKSERYHDFFAAVEYMKNNFMQADLSVEYLSVIAKMSNTYFRKLFVEKYGETPSKCILGLRLSYAEKLLSTGKYSINEAALMSGFSDPKYFCRVVKKVYGCPPSKVFIHY